MCVIEVRWKIYGIDRFDEAYAILQEVCWMRQNICRAM